MSSVIESCSRLQNWFVKSALPLWVAKGYDHQHGGFYEALDFSGAPMTGQPRRARVQARQIYTFTLSAQRGWCEESETLAAKGFEFFLDHACPEGGQRGCVHLLSDDGSVLDDRRDLYDQAFLLLACAARWKAVKDERALTLANAAIEFIETELHSPHGGWLESDAGETPRRQNPHMHLFEAFLMLHEVTQTQYYFDYAKKIHGLFLSSFYDEPNGVLREFFDAELAPAQTRNGSLVEPGHMVEWVWLLDLYARSGAQISEGAMDTLFARAREIGADQCGFLVDSLQLEQIEPAQTRRLWPQTEYVKAALVLARRGRTSTAVQAAQMIDRIDGAYLNQPVAGLWCDQYLLSGKPIAENVPASILYHLYEAAAEASDYVTFME
jgi:mannose/cellobiose epimerase-like protein (N-acyl-D-glucosamine 2-epimerase family)